MDKGEEGCPGPTRGERTYPRKTYLGKMIGTAGNHVKETLSD